MIVGVAPVGAALNTAFVDVVGVIVASVAAAGVCAVVVSEASVCSNNPCNCC